MSGSPKLTLVWSHAAQRSSDKISKAARLILDNPAIGTKLEYREDRELYAPFGKGGYILRYKIIAQ